MQVADLWKHQPTISDRWISFLRFLSKNMNISLSVFPEVLSKKWVNSIWFLYEDIPGVVLNLNTNRIPDKGGTRPTRTSTPLPIDIPLKTIFKSKTLLDDLLLRLFLWHRGLSPHPVDLRCFTASHLPT